MTCVFAVSPIILWVFLVCFKDKLKNTQFTITWGVLYQNLRLERIMTVLYNFFFIFRRLTYAISIIFVSVTPGIQILTQMLMSLF
jgi:hypothetical protein